MLLMPFFEDFAPTDDFNNTIAKQKKSNTLIIFSTCKTNIHPTINQNLSITDIGQLLKGIILKTNKNELKKRMRKTSY
jgi:hypothetical protein